MGGADKALLPLSGRPLLAHVLDRLAPQLVRAGGRMALSANGDAARFAAFGLPVLPDAHPDTHLVDDAGTDAAPSLGAPSLGAPSLGAPSLGAPSLGPLSGILAGLVWAAAGGAGALVSVPVDAPHLPADLLARLAAAAQPGRPVLASAAGRSQPATALWPVTLVRPLAQFLASGAKAKITDFAAAHGAVTVAFPDPAAFANLNTPEDLVAAERATAEQTAAGAPR